MANSKISALTSATTPLAGTETLPIVQSGATKQVSVANLTAGRAVSASTLTTTGSITGGTGIFLDRSGAESFVQLASSAVVGGQFRWVAANQVSIADSGGVAKVTFNTSTGNTTLNTGNLIQGTAAKGVNFTANTPAAGMTSQLLNWYEEGTWTPDLLIAGGNTGIIYTSRSGRYTRNGRQVQVECSVVLSNKGARVGGVRIDGLPYTLAIDAMPATVVPTGTWAGLIVGGSIQAYVSGTAVYLLLGTLTGTAALTNTNLSNTSAFTFTAIFSV